MWSATDLSMKGFFIFIYFLAEMLTYFNSYLLDKVRFGGSPKRIQQYTVLVFY